MRKANNKEQFTPFGIWLQEYVRNDLSITNLDFVIEDYKAKKIMLLEEKQCSGKLHPAQLLTFNVIDYALFNMAKKWSYDYWGFFVLILPQDATMPGPGMTLNGYQITAEQLQDHLNFRNQFCQGYEFPWWKDDSKIKATKESKQEATCN